MSLASLVRRLLWKDVLSEDSPIQVEEPPAKFVLIGSSFCIMNLVDTELVSNVVERELIPPQTMCLSFPDTDRNPLYLVGMPRGKEGREYTPVCYAAATADGVGVSHLPFNPRNLKQEEVYGMTNDVVLLLCKAMAPRHLLTEDGRWFSSRGCYGLDYQSALKLLREMKLN